MLQFFFLFFFFILRGRLSILGFFFFLLCLVFIAVSEGFSSCGAQPLEHRLSSWRCVGLVAHGMWNLSSLARDQICVRCTGRQTPNLRATREVLVLQFLRSCFSIFVPMPETPLRPKQKWLWPFLIPV